MATYLEYFIFFERLCTEHKTMTESTRPRGCHFIVQKTDILATTGMKATFDFTLKKSENKYAALTIWRKKSTFGLRSRKAEYKSKFKKYSNKMMQQLYCVLRLL